MLSDAEMDRRIRENVKKYPIDLPESYKNMVKVQVMMCCDEKEKNGNRMKIQKHAWNKIVVACMVIFIIAGGSIGVHAAINQVQERMGRMSQQEKTSFWEEAGMADVDTFSRELTESEKERINLLAKKYQQDGFFPENELLRISSAEEAIPDRICFLAENSTFYLPDAPMTDEDLLELIDFYYKRDYSIESTSRNEEDDYQKVEEISHEEAVGKASAVLETVFGIDTDSFEIETQYDQALDSNGETFTRDFVSFRDESEGIMYQVVVKLQTGQVDTISYEMDGKSNYSKNEKELQEFYRELCEDAEKMAERYFEREIIWSNVQIEYLINEDNFLNTGIVNYIFENGQDTCIISYSCSQKCFYMIRHISQEELDAYMVDENNQAKERNLKMVAIPVNE